MVQKKGRSHVTWQRLTKAMLRAAEATPNLIPISSLNQLLETAATAEHPELLDFVAEAFDKPEFDKATKELFENHLDEVIFYYSGDLVDGEVEETDSSTMDQLWRTSR